MGTSGSITSETNGNLPVPKVAIGSFDVSGLTNKRATIQLYNNITNTSTSSYKLLNFPRVIPMDLTDEQISQGVYIEMVIYKKQIGARKTKGSGFVIPPSYINGVNLFNGRDSRGGLHYKSNTNPLDPNETLSNTLLEVNRPNHYKVVSRTQAVNVWEYLHNRHYRIPVTYRKLSSFSTALVNCPISNPNKGFGKSYMYRSMYAPLYFSFRYIQDLGNRFISGPLSPVFKLVHEYHPFRVLGKQVNGNVYGDIHPYYDPNYMICKQV
jgi:hypothetical protein